MLFTITHEINLHLFLFFFNQKFFNYNKKNYQLHFLIFSDLILNQNYQFNYFKWIKQDKSNQITKLRSTTSKLYSSHKKNNISSTTPHPDYNIINNLPTESPIAPTHNRTLTEVNDSSKTNTNKKPNYLNTDSIIKEEVYLIKNVFIIFLFNIKHRKH